MNPIFQSIIFKFVLYVIVEFVRSYENERSFHCLWLYYFHIILQEHTCPITKSTNYQISLQTLLECFNHRLSHNVHLYVIIMLQTIIIPLLKAGCIFLNLSDWIISYRPIWIFCIPFMYVLLLILMHHALVSFKFLMSILDLHSLFWGCKTWQWQLFSVK